MQEKKKILTLYCLKLIDTLIISQLVDKSAPVAHVWTVAPAGIWDQVVEKVANLRKESSMLKLFTEHVKGEEMYGLTVHAVMRITESVGEAPHALLIPRHSSRRLLVPAGVIDAAGLGVSCARATARVPLALPMSR